MAAGTWCRKGERTREKPVESRAIVTRFRDFARDTRRSVTSPCLAKFSAICFVLLGGDDHGTPIRNFRRANREFITSDSSRARDRVTLSCWFGCRVRLVYAFIREIGKTQRRFRRISGHFIGRRTELAGDKAVKLQLSALLLTRFNSCFHNYIDWSRDKYN